MHVYITMYVRIYTYMYIYIYIYIYEYSLSIHLLRYFINIFYIQRYFHILYYIISPPDLFWGGVCLPTFCPGGTFASFWLKFNKKLANILLYAIYNILYQKYINKMTFAGF